MNKDYVDAGVRAGGVPLIIPFTTDKEVIISQAQLIDGLILSGGHDVSPYNYGQEPNPKLGETFPERDTYDMLLLEESKKCSSWWNSISRFIFNTWKCFKT